MDSENPPSPSEDTKIKIEPNSEAPLVEVTKRKRKKSEKRKAQERERQRRVRANQSEEQRRLETEKKLWRRRIREGHPSITEEKLVELKEKYGIDVDKMRERFNPECRQQRLKKDAERQRKNRAMLREARNNLKKMTAAEKLEENRARQRFQRLQKRLLMTEEEKEQHRMKQYLQMQVYYAKHGRYYEKSREEKDQQNAKQKVWRDNLTPEGRKRYYDSMRRSQKRRLERYKAADPQYQSKKQAAYWSKVKSEDIGKWRKYRERLNAYQRKKYQAETEEERKKRRYKDKVNGVKRKLKKTLEQEGVEASEMEKRLKEVHEQMWKEFDPEWTWEKYKQRNKVQKKVDPSISLHGEPSATATNIQASFCPGHHHLKGNQNEKEPEAVECLLPSTLLHTRLPVKPSDPLTGSQLPPVSQDSSTSVEYVHAEALGSNSHNSEHDGGDVFCPSPSSPPLPSPEPMDDTSFLDTPSLPAHDHCPVAATFKCTFCTLEFFEDCDLRDHMRSSHSDKVWTCPKCNAVVLFPQELSSHFQSVHKATSKPERKNIPTSQSKLNFFCMSCCPVKEGIVGFSTRLELFAHVKKKHRRQSFWPCDRCSILKYSSQAFEVHLSICKLSKSRSNRKRSRVKR